MFWNLGFGIFWKFWGFSKLLSYLWNFGMGFHLNEFKTSYIAFRCVLLVCVLIGLDWAGPMMQFVLHVTCSCISYAYVLSFPYIWYIWIVWEFYDYFSLFLPLNLFTLVMSMAPKRKSTPAWNPLRSGASSSTDPSPSNIRFRDDDAFKAFS